MNNGGAMTSCKQSHKAARRMSQLLPCTDGSSDNGFSDLNFEEDRV